MAASTDAASAGPVGQREPQKLGGDTAKSPVLEGVARRFTYVLFLRVVLTTLLLVAAVATFLPSAEEATSARNAAVFATIALNYGLTLVWALALRRGSSPRRVASLQAAVDVVVVTLLLHADGGAESGFVLLHLLVIVGAAMVLSARGTALTTAASVAAYLSIAGLDRLGWLPPWPGAVYAETPWNSLFFTLSKNVVFFLATAALARRLVGELEHAGERIAAQGLRLDELATLHDDVVRSLASGLLTLADSGVVRSLNPAGEEILGLAASRAVGRRVADVFPEISFQIEAAAGPMRRGELDFHRSDGQQRHLGISISPLVDARGGTTGRIVNFQDLTELSRIRERAERAEHLAGIGRLAAGVAHEIRNPLAAISGSIELLRVTLDLDGDNLELMEIVTREAERLNRLITEMLDFARPRQPEFSLLDVGAAVQEILRVTDNDRRVSPTRGRVRLACSQPVWVAADPAQLRQVVLNLVINAADATPADKAIDVQIKIEGDQAVIAIRDRGPGIPAPLRARIFEPFFSTKKGGTGLGLPTVHRIIEEHHGSISIDDAPGGGAILTVRLPRSEAPAMIPSVALGQQG